MKGIYSGSLKIQVHEIKLVSIILIVFTITPMAAQG